LGNYVFGRIRWALSTILPGEWVTERYEPVNFQEYSDVMQPASKQFCSTGSSTQKFAGVLMVDEISEEEIWEWIEA
jgi:hypothetical protein